jgi:hypothetical protein
MDRRNIPWKSEWKAAGVDPGPLTEDEAALVPVLEAENRRFLAAHPFRKASEPRRGVRLGLWVAPLAAAAAVLVFLSVPLVQFSSTGSSMERMKGASDPVLVVYRQGKSGPERLSDRASVRPGDLLQAAYRVSKPVQGVLLSLDGGGNVSVHLAREGRSVALVPGNETNTPLSFELDRAPLYEVFFLFTSDKPFDLEPLRQTLKSSPWNALKPGAFGPDIRFTVLALTKESQR